MRACHLFNKYGCTVIAGIFWVFGFQINCDWMFKEMRDCNKLWVDYYSIWAVLWESVLIKVPALVVNGNTSITELRYLNMQKFSMAQNIICWNNAMSVWLLLYMNKLCVIAFCCSIHAMKLWMPWWSTISWFLDHLQLNQVSIQLKIQLVAPHNRVSFNNTSMSNINRQ